LCLCQALPRPTTLLDTTPPQARTRPTTKRATQAVIGESRVAHHHDCISYVAHTSPTTALSALQYRAFIQLARIAYGSPHISWYTPAEPASRTTITLPGRETLYTSYCITRSYGSLAGLLAHNTFAVPLYTLRWLCEWPLRVSSHTCLNSHSPDTLSWKPRTRWSQSKRCLRLPLERRRRNYLGDSQYSTP
jgi:hypothetical protein